MEKFNYFLSRLNMFLFLLVLGIGLGFLVRGLATKYTYPRSYMLSVNTPTYGAARIIGILQEFNKLGTEEVVTWDKGIRPITITEANLPVDLAKDRRTIGLTYVGITKCSITISPTIADYQELNNVVIHEYLDCFGYDHVDNSTDIMNSVYTQPASEENARQYAQSLVELIYGK